MIQPVAIVIYLYDGTYPGLLSAIFETYRLQSPAVNFAVEDAFSGDLFAASVHVTTQPEWADRVRAGLVRKTSARAADMLYRAFHTEVPGVEMLLYTFIKRAMAASENIEEDYTDPTVVRLWQLDRQIGREVHRMHAFVRFQRTHDELFYAVIDPDFNVLPLIGAHFEKRYVAQRWVIYDSRRRFGIYYDLTETRFVTFDLENYRQLQQLPGNILQEDEAHYQTLWKTYFHSVNIPERRNMKLHLKHVPKRYWKYLVEKG